MKRIMNGFICIFLLMQLTGCGKVGIFSDNGQPYKETQFIMDTVIEITAYGDEKEQAVQKAFQEFKRIQKISDRFQADSQVSEINRSAGISPVTVDEDLIRMLEAAREISERTDGAFDITVGPLTELWGIGRKDQYIPDQASIDKILPLIDYRQVQIDGVKRTVYLPKAGMLLDMGGMAKDYGMNLAANVLQAQGIRSALINAGGDIRVLGTKPDGKPWRIGVQDPRNAEGVIAKVSLAKWDILQTSGDYQRFFMKDGMRYAHILNPKTGRQPGELASVTLVYKNDMLGANKDIASSGFMVMGLAKSLEAIKKFPGVEAIFVGIDGKVTITDGLKNFVER